MSKTKKKVNVAIKSKEQVIQVAEDCGFTSEQIEKSKQAMDELVALSEDLGLYDDPTPLEASVEAVGSVCEETEARVAQTVETPSSTSLEPLNATAEDAALLDELLGEVTEENKHPELISVDDKLTLKDAWNRPIPTKQVVIEALHFNTLVEKVLYAAYLGAELDTTFNIKAEFPYKVGLLFPEANYDKFLANEDVPVYNDNVGYVKVIVKGFDRIQFFTNIVKLGKEGAFIEAGKAAQRKPFYNIPLLCHRPIEDKIDIVVGVKKVVYSREELESFGMAELTIICKWHKLPLLKSKDKNIKQILEKQKEIK